MTKASNLKTEIVAVGSELLAPGFQDTNSLFIAERLEDLGIRVSFKTVVGDDPEDLLVCLRAALKRAHVILVTGGLGPTEDDRTREVMAKALGRDLVYSPAIQRRIRDRFRRRGARMTASNRKQAYVIEGGEILENSNGTAPGLWISIGSRRIVLLPGPPHELKPMFETSVMPRLADRTAGYTLRRVLKITGMGESFMEDRLRSIYPKVPPNVRLITLASPGELQIHLSISGRDDRSGAVKVLSDLEKRLLARLGQRVFSRGGENLEEVVGCLLAAHGRTVACAESCTGGFLGHRITNVPGSSTYFLESIVAYSDEAKTRLLGVPSSILLAHGAVSAPVAEAMARGVMESSGADYGLAVTGIAGPGGGTAVKPLGLVYTALAWGGGASVEKNLFLGARGFVKFQSSQKVLDQLRLRLLGEPSEKP